MRIFGLIFAILFFAAPCYGQSPPVPDPIPVKTDMELVSESLTVIINTGNFVIQSYENLKAQVDQQEKEWDVIEGKFVEEEEENRPKNVTLAGNFVIVEILILRVDIYPLLDKQQKNASDLTIKAVQYTVDKDYVNALIYSTMAKYAWEALGNDILMNVQPRVDNVRDKLTIVQNYYSK